MKKVFLFIFVLIVLAVVGFFIFLFTFDADSLKPELTKRISEFVGNPVKIGRLQLTWKGGLVLQMTDFAILRRGRESEEPAVGIREAGIQVRLTPLLQKRVEIGSVRIIAPHLDMIKDPDGTIRIDGIEPARESAPKKETKPTETGGEAEGGSSLAQGIVFLIDTVKIEDARIGFTDQTFSPPRSLTIRNFDLTVFDVAMSGDLKFRTKAAVFSPSQNVSAEGVVQLISGQGFYGLKDLKVETDLSRLSLADLRKFLPEIRSAGIRDDLEGRASAEIHELKVERGVSELDATLDLSDGRIAFEQLRPPLENLKLKANVSRGDLHLRELSASFARGTINSSGTSRRFLEDHPESAVKIEMNRIYLEDVLPAPRANQPQVQGVLTANFAGRALGMDWPAISKTLTGEGRIQLREGRVANLNLLRIVFDKLTKVPGVSETLNNNLTPYYREILSKPDTRIRDMDFPATIQNGVLSLPDLQVISDGYAIFGAARVGLDGSIDSQARLMLDGELSGILVQGAPQLQYIMDPNGQLSIPVRITGNVENLRVLPDMDYVFQRVLLTKGQELLTRTLDKTLGKSTETTADAASTGETKLKNILGSFFE